MPHLLNHEGASISPFLLLSLAIKIKCPTTQANRILRSLHHDFFPTDDVDATLGWHAIEFSSI